MKKKRGEFSLKREYKECWDYIKDSRRFIFWIIGIFFAFTLFGFLVPAPEYISEQILLFIEELLSETEGLSQLQLIQFIFFNNLQSSFFGMVLGVFFGIFPILAAVVNGYLLGFVSILSVNGGGFSTLLSLLPHGIFEFPAIFLSFGLGLRLGASIFKKNSDEFKKNLKNSLKVFLLIIVPLLVIAGIIEGTLISLAG